MVPATFANFFIASASAGAALVGLLFVAVSIAPENIVLPSAPLVRQAIATSTFTALVNPFFISLSALVPATNLGTTTLVMSLLGLLNSVTLGWRLVRESRDWQGVVRRSTLIAVGIVLYGAQCNDAIGLLRNPSDVGAIYALTTLVVVAYGLGLVRAWQLLGARRFGFVGWFSIARELHEEERETTTAAADAHRAPATSSRVPPAPSDRQSP